jgi:molecular chaperone GrpE
MKNQEMENQEAEQMEEAETGESTSGEETAETTDAAAENAEETASEKKGFFSKMKDKKDKKDTQIEELTDKLRRQMAEFDNFRKRTDKEKSGMFEMGAKSVIEKMLPVVDNFERGLGGIPEDQKDDPFVAGMEMVYKQLLTVFDDLGVKPIEAVGAPFDPNFHNAVMHVEDESVGDNIVVEELQKGYTYKDFVVRHSMVKVAN